MASKEIFKSGSGIRLFSGLEWRLLDTNQSVDATLRAMGRERSATHAAVSKSLTPETSKVGKKTKEIHRYAGGFFVTSEGDGPGKKAHSLASAFALWTAQHEKAALSVHSPNGGIAVVVVLNGLPYLDKVVETDTEAYAIVTGYLKDNPGMSIFADDIEKYPSSLMEHDLLETVASAAGKTTVIKEIPPDVVKLTMIALFVVLAIGGYQYYSAVQAEEARQLALKRQLDEDPVPKYLSALNAQRNQLGVDRASLVAAFNSARKIPTDVSGWQLSTVECAMGAGCSALYKRTTGTYKSLTQAVGFLKLSQPESMNLNEARMTWEQELTPAVIDPQKPVIGLREFVDESPGSTFQNWMVAELGLQIQVPELWPQVPGVPTNFKHPAALKVGKVEVSDVPLPLLEEVLLQAPQNIVWSDFMLQVGEAKGDVKSRVKVKVSGKYYVQN